MSKAQKIQTKQYIQDIYADKIGEMWERRSQLENYINWGKDIPAILVKRYFDCFVKRDGEEIYKEKNRAIKETLKYFSIANSKTSEYNFSVSKVESKLDFDVLFPHDLLSTSKTDEDKFYPTPEKLQQLSGGKTKNVYSLAGLVGQIFTELSYNYNSETRGDKGKCLRFIYRLVSGYTDYALKRKKQYSQYQTSVLSGFIGAQLGYLEKLENHKDTDYHAYLHQQMKTYAKPIKRKTALKPKPNSNDIIK